jgi:hypothetical protein
LLEAVLLADEDFAAEVSGCVAAFIVFFTQVVTQADACLNDFAAAIALDDKLKRTLAAGWGRGTEITEQFLEETHGAGLL